MRPPVVALLALPALLTLGFGFASGGYFVGATGLAAVFLAIVLAVRVTLAERPFGGVSAPVLVAVAALALFAIWTLGSALWSRAPARALLEFDRALLYLLFLVVLGSLRVTPARLEWALRAFAVAVIVVCLAGLVSRLAPDVLPTSFSAASERLSYPVSYWNALGLLAAIGILVCLHVTSGARQSRLVRALGAAAIPPLAVTLLLTFSRGAIGVLVLALLVYVALARPSGLIGGAVAAAPLSGLAVVAAYRADALASPGPATPAAVAQGHDLAVIVALCALGAGGLRALLAGLDARVERLAREPGRRRTLVPVAAVLGLVVVAFSVAVAGDLASRVSRGYERFVAGDSLQTADVRDRLTTPANNGRLDNWAVALENFSDAPVLGHGAGTYQILWARDRALSFNVIDGHSLYLEVLSELGLVGLALLLVALLTILGFTASRARGPDRSLYAALVAAMVAWGVHAGLDWHWEMPVVTAWVFGLGGLAIAARGDGARGRPPASLTRILAALGCLLLALTPGLAALSQLRLDESVAAFRRGDCAGAAEGAVASISFLSARPQPYELLAYCDVRAGLPRLAVKTMGKALARDPENWEYHYGLALVRAAAGLEPRPQARASLALNPLNPLARAAVRDFRTDDSREWRRRALKARLPLAP